MNKTERDALIQQYTQGHAVVIEALAGISEAEQDARHDVGEVSVPGARRVQSVRDSIASAGMTLSPLDIVEIEASFR